MSNDGNVPQQLMLEFGSRDDMRLFRNNNGKLQDLTGRWVTFGLGVGTSDLVGFTAIKVEPWMVGRKFAVFTAIECKRPDYNFKPSGQREREHLDQQRKFIRLVSNMGGIACFATCPDDVHTAIRLFKA